MFAFQWKEFSSPLSSAHRLLQCYHRPKRYRRRCNSRGIPNQPPATRAISQWARILEWRHAVSVAHSGRNFFFISFFLFYCEGMLSLVVLWLCVKKDQSRIINFIDQMNGIQVTKFHIRSTELLNYIESTHGLNQSSKQDDQNFISLLDYPWPVVSN